MAETSRRRRTARRGAARRCPRIRFGPRSSIIALVAGADGRRPTRGSRDRAPPRPSKGRPQLPCCAVGEVGVEAVAAVGTERLGHAEQVRPGAGRRPQLGREHGVEAARRAASCRSAVAKAGSAAIVAAWSGQPRNSVARSRSRKPMVVAGRRVGLGEQGGAGDQRRQQAASRTRPSRRTASGCRAGRPRRCSARSSPAAVARIAPPWVWITPFGRPRLPEVNMTARSSAGRTRAASAVDHRSGREIVGQRVGRPHRPQVRAAAGARSAGPAHRS